MTSSLFYIFSFFTLCFARIGYENNKCKPNLMSNILALASVIFTGCFFVDQFVNHLTIMIIPHILFYITAFIFIIFKVENEPCIPLRIAAIVSVIVFIMCGGRYLSNFSKADKPDVSITTYTLVSLNDSDKKGETAHGVFYCKVDNTKELTYKVYYKTENGGMRLKVIPAENTTLYYIDSNTLPYMEKIETTEFYYNNNKKEPTRHYASIKTTYNLYIPEGSLINEIEDNSK